MTARTMPLAAFAPDAFEILAELTEEIHLEHRGRIVATVTPPPRIPPALALAVASVAEGHDTGAKVAKACGLADSAAGNRLRRAVKAGFLSVAPVGGVRTYSLTSTGAAWIAPEDSP